MPPKPLSWSSRHAKPLRILLLGGTGFVGRSLIARLARQHHRLLCLTRQRDQHRDLQTYPTLQLIDADVHAEAVLTEYARDADVIINLVGILNQSRQQSFQKNHTDLMHTLIRVAKQTGVRRLIALGALGADVAGPSEYLRSKGRAEQALRAEPDLAWTILRPSVIFGPRDNFLNQFAQLLRFTPVLPLARTHTRFAPVYVDDVAHAIERCLMDGRTVHQRYDLGGPEVFSLKQLIDWVSAHQHLHRYVLSLPDWLGYLQALSLEILPNPPMSRDNFASLSIDSVPAQDGFAQLGMTPHPLSRIVPSYWPANTRAALG